MRTATIISSIMTIVIVSNSNAQEWVNVNPTFNPPGSHNMSLGIFVDEKNGWFTETFPGRTWRTQDGGLTWSMQIDSSAVWSYNIEFVDCNYGWIIGKRISDYVPFLRRTKNGGDNWDIFSLPEEFVAIKFFDSLKGFAGGNDGIYYTEDGGETWENSTIEQGVSFGVWDICFSDRQHGWAVGMHGTITDCGIILKTTDGGETWNVNVPEATATGMGVFFTDSLHGAVVGSNPPFFEGTIMRTEDGGENWENQYLPCSWLNDIVFTDDSTGWTVGDFGFIWKTIDRGKTWNRIESGTTNYLNRIVFVEDGKVGFIFGEKNTLLRYEEESDMVEEKQEGYPMNFKLYPNYPNPFNGETDIEYELLQAGYVYLRILNLAGEEVVTLKDGWQPMGRYFMKWNGKDKFGKEVSAEMYLCYLQVGHFSQLCKLCLIR